MARLWEELGERVGLKVVDEEEVEQDEEDSEVENFLERGKETRKLVTGMYRFYVKHVKQCTVQYMY